MDTPLDDRWLGMAAGLGTAVCFTMTAFFFTAGGRRIGSIVVNAVRIYLAIGFLVLTHRLTVGTWFPDDLIQRQVVLLAVSGVLGLSIGDQALFTAFIDIGPRLSALIMTAAPLVAALLGWMVLGEALGVMGWLGVALTIGGIVWVILERQPALHGARPPHFGRGIVLAFIGAACQAGGLLLSKQGMGHGWLPPDARLNAQSATLVRMAAAAVGTIPFIVWRLRTQYRRSPAGQRAWTTGLAFTAAGAVVGPFLGVWMSLVASDRVELGIAQTLVSMVPIFILPAAAVVYRERITFRGVLGACLAVGGAALLFIKS